MHLILLDIDSSRTENSDGNVQKEEILKITIVAWSLFGSQVTVIILDRRFNIT